MSLDYNAPVALHPEGVDRNISIALIWVGEVASPST